jgi:hypothetical protein
MHQRHWEANSNLADQEILEASRFINVFTKTRHWILYSASWIQSIPIC